MIGLFLRYPAEGHAIPLYFELAAAMSRNWETKLVRRFFIDAYTRAFPAKWIPVPR